MPWLEPSPLSSITLDEVLTGHTCDPITLADFEAYLEYKEHTVENLQFIVWYQSYRSRFFELPLTEQARSPGPTEFNFHPPDAARLAERVRESERMFNALNFHGLGSPSAQSFKHRKLDSEVEFGDAVPMTPLTPTSPAGTCSTGALDHIHSMSSPLLKKPAEYLGRFGPLCREDLERQPMRTECMAVLQTFIVAGAPKELSLSHDMRDMILRDTAWNTHPDIFLPVYEQIYDTLSMQSLPAFLRLAATNVNMPKALYWYAFGFLYMIFSLVVFIPLVFMGPGSVHKRSWRCFSIPFSSLGMMQIYSGYRGLCTEVWSRGRSQLRPWDLQMYEDDDSNESDHNHDIGHPDCATNHVDSGVAEGHSPDDEERGHQKYATTSTTGNDTAYTQSTLSVDQTDCGARKRKSHANLHDAGTSASSVTETDTRSYRTARSTIADLHPPSPTHARPPSLVQIHPPSRAAFPNPAVQFPFEMPNKEKSEVEAKPTMFGPERPLLDPRIQKVHALIVRDMLIVGVVWTAIWVAVVCVVPGRK